MSPRDAMLASQKLMDKITGKMEIQCMKNITNFSTKYRWMILH